jgi:hypothetical protein
MAKLRQSAASRRVFHLPVNGSSRSTVLCDSGLQKTETCRIFSRAEPFVGTQIKIAASAGIADRKILGAEIERQFHKHFLSK